MGLPAARTISPRFKKQIYITILRRNWHLLPYDQLLTLMDMTAEELAFCLREDDFLFHKLGNLKPKVPPLLYHAPDKNTLARAEEIKKLVQTHFNDTKIGSGEPRFNFIEELSAEHTLPELPAYTDSSDEGLRFIYSYFGVFGDPLIDGGLNPFPDGLLARLAEKGINGIWMHVVLNQLVPRGKEFPEFGAQHLQRLASLQKIVDRAKKYGIKVYLYMNEPRAMPPSFYKSRPEMAGVQERDFIAMCTSNTAVLDWISNSLAYVFTKVRDLGGVFTITASENFTNCASHGNQKDCPRCSKRDYADIIVGVNRAIEKGVHQGNPKAKVIVWDWGWRQHGDASDIIAKLPDSVWFMSVSEWAKPIERGGIKSMVGEYSISAVGPGPRATRHWSVAKAAGLKTVAKVQFNNTWELSAVPWLPTLDLITQHAANLAKAGIDGSMLSWSLGGYPSPNLEVAQQFAENPHANPEEVLNAIARKRYGQQAAPLARKAWTAFSKAFQQFPYGGSILYRAPQQYGPANLLYPKPTGYAATMVGFPYDDLNGWRGQYPRDVFVYQFDKMADGWKKGLELFEKMILLADPEKQALAQDDFYLAQAVYLHFTSVANQARFVIARDALLSDTLSENQKSEVKKEIDALLTDEIALSKALWKITAFDSRIGFEATNQYYYVEQDLIEKVINCEYIRQHILN